MTFTEMDRAIEEARLTQLLCDTQATAMARMLVGRLRKVQRGHVLAELKRELRKFNMQRGTWSD